MPPSLPVSIHLSNSRLFRVPINKTQKPNSNPNSKYTMKIMKHHHLLSIFSLSLLLPCSLSFCANSTEYHLLLFAFSSVSGFVHPELGPTCQPVKEILLPSRNLTGTVSWAALGNLSSLRRLDLSGNALQGSIPGRFWSAPSLVHVSLAGNRLGGALRFGRPAHLGRSYITYLNLSNNRFTSDVDMSHLSALKVLDLSRNRLGFVSVGLKHLTGLKHLDLSHNSINGVFPEDLPPLSELRFLNISYNNFSGRVSATELKKFGKSAFIKAGRIIFLHSSSPPPRKSEHKHKNEKRVITLSLIATSVIALCLVLACVFSVVNCTRKRKKKESMGEEERSKDIPPLMEEQTGWVAEAKWSAPVVIFEKPLMQLTFADLAAAAAGFGRESQLAEGGGRSGAAYRAVLPGDLHVVIRVAENARDLPEQEAAAEFCNLARLRHPNLLPLLGYCVAGKEKLLLYEYMERGDLHRWLHELPAGKPDVEDFSGDTWQVGIGEESSGSTGDWSVRHRIALGVTRGLAFLHQGWAGSGRPVVHGHLVPTNVLLGDDLEPRIADFGGPHNSGGTPEGDVYAFGEVLFELMTGRTGWDDPTVRWARGLVRDGRGLDLVDPRLLADGVGPDSQREMVECLRVGYLCTAESADKRPTMQQVVGLIKDVRAKHVATESKP